MGLRPGEPRRRREGSIQGSLKENRSHAIAMGNGRGRKNVLSLFNLDHTQIHCITYFCQRRDPFRLRRLRVASSPEGPDLPRPETSCVCAVSRRPQRQRLHQRQRQASAAPSAGSGSVRGLEVIRGGHRHQGDQGERCTRAPVSSTHLSSTVKTGCTARLQSRGVCGIEV